MAKHNKKRNTAFIYEALVREIIKQTINNDKEKRDRVINILKEGFKKNSEIKKELDLYKILLETKGLPEKLAEKLINETIKQHKKINQEKIFHEQSKIISIINQEFSKRVFNNFVPNYKSLATISQIFNDSLSPKSKILLEDKIVKNLIEEPEEQKKNQQTSTLITQAFVTRFNETYDSFQKDQKELLSKYIFSFEDEGVEFNFHLNEEIGRLKKALLNAQSLEEVKQDSTLKEKIEQVLNLLEDFNKSPVNKDKLLYILQTQVLAKELQS